MRTLRHSAVSILAFAPIMAAQLHVGGLTTDPGAPIDFSASAATTPTGVGTNLPGTCAVGQQFFKSNNSAGTELYLCTSTNIWTQVIGGGGGGMLDPGSNGIMKRTALNTTAAATATDISGLNYVPGSGTAQAQSAALATPITSLTNGLDVCWLPAAANTGPAPTLAVNGLAAKSVTKYGTTVLAANDLTTTAIACALYDGTEFQLQNPQTAPVFVKTNGGAPVGPQSTLNLIPGTGLAGFTGVLNGSQIDVTLPIDTAYFKTNFGKVLNPQTSTYQVLASDFSSYACNIIPVSSGTFTITLVASGSQPSAGECLYIINYGSGVVTVARNGQNINGAAANLTLAAGSASAPTGMFVVSDATNYIAEVFGAGGTVSSVFGRTGAVTAQSGDYTAAQVTNAVDKSAANTAAAGMTLDMSGATGAAALKVPVIAGATAGQDGVIDYDSTNKNTHTRVNGSDALVVGEAVAIAANAIPKATNGTQSLLTASSITDNGTQVATAEPVAIGSSPPVITAGTAGTWAASEGTAFTNVAGAAGIYPDSTAHEFIAKTNGASTGGIMVRAQPGAIHSTGNVAAITTATLCAAAAGACNTAGQYHVHWDFIETGTACSSVTAGSVTFLLTWTDSNGTAHSAVALQMMNQTGAATTAMGGTFTFATALANAGASGDFNISTNGTVIQYATGYTACTTGTGTYQLDATVTRLQ